MTFERFTKKGDHQNEYHCSIGKGYRIVLSVGLVRKLGIIPISVTTFFDLETNRIGLELHEGLEPEAYRLSSAGNTYFFHAKNFLSVHQVKLTQFGISSTIEEIDGKRMIVFPVEVEVSDD